MAIVLVEMKGTRVLHRFLQITRVVIILLIATLLGTAFVPLQPVRDPSLTDSFQDVMLPKLLALEDSVDEVESLVASRSRNILALQGHATRIETVVAEIDDYLLSTEYANEHTDVVERYELGRDAVLSVIGEAQAAMRSFEFAAIPGLVPQFAIGAERLREAVALLQTPEPAGSS